ncbi:hypothetical protein PENSPDRAFT_685525 [Peniophora sp. CONT]|nr:hypothetical protein PENSPDRAFT_685525 [Peniophora sp. CONT]
MSTPNSMLDDVYVRGYYYGSHYLMPISQLGAVLFGMMTMAMMLTVYKYLRPGITPLNARVTKRLARLAALVVMYTLYTTYWAISVRYAWVLLSGGWIGYRGTPPTSVYSFFGPILLECAAFGMFCTLTALSVYIFAHKNLRARAQQVMFAAALLMSAISLAHWVLEMRFVAATSAKQTHEQAGIALAPLALVSVNIVLSDTIVLWRMCVLCQQHRGARVLAAALLTSTIALTITSVAEMAIVDSVKLRNGSASFSDLKYGTALLALSLATNFISTSMIGWRTWLYRRGLSAHLATFSRNSVAEKVMTLLVESGCVYCIIWVLYVVDSRSNYDNHYIGGAPYFNRFMAHITGIYPTIILVIVALEKSYLENALYDTKQFSAFLAAQPPTLQSSNMHARSALPVSTILASSTPGSAGADVTRDEDDCTKPNANVNDKEKVLSSPTMPCPEDIARAASHTTEAELAFALSSCADPESAVHPGLPPGL